VTGETNDPWHDDFDDIEADPVHLRNYAVRSFRLASDRLLIRGVVDDRKPGHTWIPWDDRPLVMHHMVVDMTVQFPELVIIEATARFKTFPNTGCPVIEGHYEQLAGLSIARGYTHRVRELFGGPKGCAHVTALLQAMGPVAIQSTWGMYMEERRTKAAAAGFDVENELLPAPSREERVRGSLRNLNTCHVFAEDGEYIANLRNGIPGPVPLTIGRRFAELGIDASAFGD
jgi:Protein of unknown function (DUF2889)